MKRFLLMFTFLLMGIYAFGQNNRNAVKTSVTGGRFEIVQSEMARKYSFKLDKKTGKIYMMVKDYKDDISWEEMRIIGLLPNKYTSDINYQLFLGGLVVADIFLIDIHSGQTWQLVQDSKDESYFWSPTI